MVIRIDTEQLVSMAQATGLVPTRTSGKKIHVATLYRWANVGLHGVRLETVQIGGHRYTSKEALGRFFQALTVRAEATPAHDEDRVARVRRQLDERLGRGRARERRA